MSNFYFKSLLEAVKSKKKLLAVLIDPEKFLGKNSTVFLQNLPKQTTHLFVGGSTVFNGETEKVVNDLKIKSNLPIFLFPGDYSQITNKADAVLFLNLISGRNPEYLIEQQVKSIPIIQKTNLEIISTGYILIDGGNTSSVARVTGTKPILQKNISTIVNTALAGQYMGAKIIYLEAGSGAKFPVNSKIIKEVKKQLSIPVIVGGGIRTEEKMNEIFHAGADMVVMGTVFEK